MKIYECLGVEHLLMDIPIPKETVLENVDPKSRSEASTAFRNIDYISLRVSLGRDDRYLQIMEIGLNSPRKIEAIARTIQKTIKYRILFVFVYQEHYLILWRNFKLTDSTEYVYSDAVSYCTDWIYKESLNSEVLWTCKTIKIDNDKTRIVPLSYKKKNKNDDDGMTYFRDVVRNVYSLSSSIINRELVSARFLVDWFDCHAIGERVDLNHLICEAIREEMYMVVDDHLFFETDRLEVLCSSIENPNYKFKVRIARTGRIPWTYFEDISYPATFEDEYCILSRLHEIIESDGQYLVNVINDHSITIAAYETKIRRAEQQRRFEQLSHKSEAQRQREEEYRKAVEEEFWQSGEAQRQEALRRVREEEARCKAEEEAIRLAEARRKAEEALRQEEARRKAEEEARRLAEARRKAEEARSQEEARCKAEEEERRLAEESRQRELARRKAEREAHRLAAAKRRADRAKRKEEIRTMAESKNFSVEYQSSPYGYFSLNPGEIALLCNRCGDEVVMEFDDPDLILKIGRLSCECNDSGLEADQLAWTNDGKLAWCADLLRVISLVDLTTFNGFSLDGNNYFQFPDDGDKEVFFSADPVDPDYAYAFVVYPNETDAWLSKYLLFRFQIATWGTPRVDVEIAGRWPYYYEKLYEAICQNISMGDKRISKTTTQNFDCYISAYNALRARNSLVWDVGSVLSSLEGLTNAMAKLCGDERTSRDPHLQQYIDQHTCPVCKKGYASTENKCSECGCEELKPKELDEASLPAKGVVVDAMLDKTRGPIATLLVQSGTLKRDDMLIAGTVIGRVRVMIDDNGYSVKTAGPSTVVKITGLVNVPNVGVAFDVVTDAKTARELVEERKRVENAKRAEEEARRKAEAEAKRVAEEEAKKKEADEARRKAEEDAKRQAEEDARRLAEAKQYLEFAECDPYYIWLSTKASNQFGKEIILAYELIQRFAYRSNLLHEPLLKTVNVDSIRKIQDAVKVRKEFIKLDANTKYYCGLAMRHYVQYLTELEIERKEKERLELERLEALHLEEIRRKAEGEVHRKAKQQITEMLIGTLYLAEKEKISQLHTALIRIEDLRKEEARKKAEEEAKRRVADEARRLAEERRRAEDAKRQEEAKRKAEEARQLAETMRMLEENRRQAEERRKAENARRQEEANKKIEARRKALEAWKKAEEGHHVQRAIEERRAQYRQSNRCQHCGGEFKGFLGIFAKKCKSCGRAKDY